MKEKVGLDMDSVFCNIEAGMLSYIRENWHPDFEFEQFCEFNFDKNKYLSAEAAKGLKDVANSGEFLYNGTLYEGADEAIEALDDIFEVHVITGRYVDRAGKLTLKWLDNYGLNFEDVHFTNGRTKEDYIVSLDIRHFVEDSPYVISGILGHKEASSICDLYCVDRPWNRHIRDGRVRRVESLLEAANIILNGAGGVL